MEIYEGCDFNFGDIETLLNIESWEICADLCLGNAKCLYFNYNADTKKCWLKAWVTTVIISPDEKVLKNVKFWFQVVSTH